jgi:O-antigen/teichoic acid export membrane protein
MIAAWRRVVDGVRRLVRVLLLFAVARVVLGLALILLFDREAVAWGYEATLVVLAACIVYAAVGLAVRRRPA